VGLWQFTQIGISSVVLCLYYFGFGQEDNIYGENKDYCTESFENLKPATIIYLFQMLTIPMNAISWNLFGLRNAHTAISQLN
jgi:hypothetical protein